MLRQTSTAGEYLARAILEMPPQNRWDRGDIDFRYSIYKITTVFNANEATNRKRVYQVSTIFPSFRRDQNFHQLRPFPSRDSGRAVESPPLLLESKLPTSGVVGKLIVVPLLRFRL
jgi:hypothetical protein